MTIAFYFNYCGESRLASRLISQLYRFYPEADKICIHDGSFDPLPGVINVGKSQLKKTDTIGLFIKRNFTVCLNNSEASTFIQIDPDSYIWKPFDAIPEADWFGDCEAQKREHFGDINVVMGYCAGFSRNAMKQVLSSGLLQDPILQQSPCYRPRRYPYGVCSEDVPLGWVMTQLKIESVKWNEVNEMRGTINKQRPPYRYAVTHPVKAAIDYHKITLP